MLVGVVSLLVLLLPLEGEGMSWPYSLHVTVNQKLIAAFILGKTHPIPPSFVASSYILVQTHRDYFLVCSYRSCDHGNSPNMIDM